MWCAAGESSRWEHVTSLHLIHLTSRADCRWRMQAYGSRRKIMHVKEWAEHRALPQPIAKQVQVSRRRRLPQRHVTCGALAIGPSLAARSGLR